MTAALLALVLVAAGPASAAPVAPAGPPLEVLEAGDLEYDVARERGVAHGGVVLRRGAVVLRADTASFDQRTGDVEARGSVLLSEPGRVLAASAMHARLDGALQASDVVAFLKDGPLDLSRCRSIDEGERTGRNRLSVAGSDLVRDAPRPGAPEHLEIEHARVTLCDCGMGPPSWQIRARHADIIPGQRALLSWPVFYVTPRFLFLDTPVPVFAFPVLYLPLAERQTGLLLPEITFGGAAGWGVSQPLFITLGRSWDATITADYSFGPTSNAMKGPGSSLELRWAPTDGMRGQLHASILHSTLQVWPTGAALPPGWNRISFSGYQEDRVSDATYYRVEVGLIDDPLYLAHFTGDALLRATDYRRSAVAVTHRRDDVLLEADAAYHLPLNYLDSSNATGVDGAPVPRAPFGTFGGDLSTFHRLPSASVTLLPLRLAGPVHLSATAGVARFAPLRGATGDEGLDGIGAGERGWNQPGGVSPFDPGERDGRWNAPAPGSPGERLAATRTLARVELRAPVSWGSWLEVEPYATATAAAYAFEAALSPQADARATAGLSLSTRIARTFGEGASRIRHEIEPRVEWRGGTGQWGPGLPNYAYDELDVALPPTVIDPATGLVKAQRTLSAIPGSFSQLQLSVRNRLIAPAGALSNAFVDLTLGQDLDATSGAASETWGRAAMRLRFFSADAYARVRAFGATTPPGTPPPSPRSRLDTFTELGLGTTLADPRGDNVHASFIALGAGASPRVLAGLEPFFDARPFAASPIAQGSVGVTGRWSGATLTYDASFNARELPAPYCPGKSTAPHVYQHAATLVWDSPCHCWKAGFSAIVNECLDRPQFKFIVDLSSFGGRNVVGF